MQNMEVKNLSYFLCILAHDLGHLGPVSLNFLNSLKYFEPPFLMRGGGDYFKKLSYGEFVIRFLITAVF